MTAARLVLSLPVALLIGCAQAPIAVEPEPAIAPAALPLVTSSGVVIGTLSYQYVEAGSAEAGPKWVVHLSRVDAPSQDYALSVDVDTTSRHGVFTGALPAGVYAFRDAASPQGRYASVETNLPFEVQAGEVSDAGHYALHPERGL